MTVDNQTGLFENRQAVQEELLEWYAEHHREYPWRETTDPYPILVSEVMSQQTQLDRIVDPWKSFLDQWPTISELAAADQAEVITFWSHHRLGYNNRARYLHETAVQIQTEFNGTFPTTPESLEKLPGIGPYTASAVASFAFDADVAGVDTNVKRILYRTLQHVRETDTPDFAQLASDLLPPGQSREWNNAIMELGGTVCQKTPRCDEEPCPLRGSCYAYQTGDFTAPDVPTQPTFEGSRRQFRGRIVRTLGKHGTLEVDELGHRIRVDYTPDGTHGRNWLNGILDDLEQERLIDRDTQEGNEVIKLRE